MVSTDDDATAPAARRATRPRPAGGTATTRVFTPLSGFFTGLLFVLLVPSVYAGVLSAVADDETTAGLFPFVLVALAVPVGLVVAPPRAASGATCCSGWSPPRWWCSASPRWWSGSWSAAPEHRPAAAGSWV